MHVVCVLSRGVRRVCALHHPVCVSCVRRVCAVCHSVCVRAVCHPVCVCHVDSVCDECHPACVCRVPSCVCVCRVYSMCVPCATSCVPYGLHVHAVCHLACVPCATPCVCTVCTPCVHRVPPRVCVCRMPPCMCAVCACRMPPRVCEQCALSVRAVCHPVCAHRVYSVCAPCVLRVCAVRHPVCVPYATLCVCAVCTHVRAVCHPGPRSATCTEHLAHTRLHASDTWGQQKAWTPSVSPPHPRAQDLRSLRPREQVFGRSRPSTLPGAEGALSLCAQRISIWPLGAAKPARRKSQESSGSQDQG